MSFEHQSPTDKVPEALTTGEQDNLVGGLRLAGELGSSVVRAVAKDDKREIRTWGDGGMPGDGRKSEGDVSGSDRQPVPAVAERAKDAKAARLVPLFGGRRHPTNVRVDGIRKAAKLHGVQLEPGRLDRLAARADQAAAAREQGQPEGYSSQAGLSVSGASPSQKDGSGPTIAHMQFAGPPEQVPGHRPPSRAEVMQAGIEALQDYVLLVEAGSIEEPDKLLGRTDSPELTRLAGRFGFTRDRDAGTVMADYNQVRNRVMGPDILRATHALAKRAMDYATIVDDPGRAVARGVQNAASDLATGVQNAIGLGDS